MRRKVSHILILLMFLVVACSSGRVVTLPDGTTRPLTSQEQSYIFIDKLQLFTRSCITAGSVYVDSHPERRPEWKAKILPVFQLVNNSLGDYLTILQKGGKVSTQEVILKVQSKLFDVLTILVDWGVIVEG